MIWGKRNGKELIADSIPSTAGGGETSSRSTCRNRKGLLESELFRHEGGPHRPVSQKGKIEEPTEARYFYEVG